MLEQNSRNWRGRLIRYAPLFLWVGVIFYLSSSQGSMVETSRFVRPLLEFLFPSAPEETLAIYHAYIRKCAHFTEYAVFAFLAVRALAGSSMAALRDWRYVLAAAAAAVIAVLDESGQSFEASRTSSGWDVLLDITGAVVMILALLIIGRPRTRSDNVTPN